MSPSMTTNAVHLPRWVGWEWRTRIPWRRVAVASLATIVVVGLYAPLRRTLSLALGDVVLFAARPFEPSTADFARLRGPSHLTASNGTPLGDLGADGLVTHTDVSLRSLPAYVPKAMLAAEDKNFY